MEHILNKTSYDYLGKPNQDGFFPISLDTIRVDSMPNFNLYNKVGESYLLYRSGNHAFTFKQQQALLEHRVSVLYVPMSELVKYWEYVENNLHIILSDPKVTVEKKARVYHATSIGLCKNIMTSEPGESSIVKADELVKSSMCLMEKGRESFHALLQLISSRSDVYNHSIHVCSYGLALAHALGLPEDRIKRLGTGLLLHDLGMLDIGDEVLNKSGPLSIDEWQAMRSHPERGVQWYLGCGGNDQEIEMIIFTHHERLDGTGYPKGLSKRKIPLVSRIASIVNIFDALTTSRSFRPALSTYGAITTMRLELKNALDQQVLSVFIRLLGG